PVTPGPIKPAHELLGEMHLELGDPAAALAEFETAQAIEPNRFWGWYDAAQAAEQAGDLEKAKGYYTTLVEMVGADSARPEVAEAQAFLAAQ
ncbi:MAG: bacterial transcriptional activator domain-containing protein, partial [Caldilineaceae bacterium]|nr:bacterial transcriptional activator domain-containing protein [Caldilineaceae bacterium]